ncbi:hypothetical protein [Paenibacillus tundrae]
MINPDFLFILSHTTNDEAKEMIENNFKSNPAWSSLSAISNDQMYFLPKDKFVLWLLVLMLPNPINIWQT